MSEIVEWFEGRSLFITGGMGFMGKVILEKLLRSVPGIKKIYVLTRAKRGVLPGNRVTEMFKLPLFEKLRNQDPSALKKLVAIEGDISLPDLGLSDGHKSLLRKEVSVVFHGAATLKLEAELKDSLVQNTIGTQNLLNFCKTFEKIESVVHLSTAFCHPDVEELEEEIYEPTRNVYDVLNFVKWIDEESLNQITPRILGPHPNTYTFTKRLAEALVKDAGNELPLIIIRPSIVVPSILEPIKGWVDSLNGPIGIIVAAGKGVIRSMLTDEKNHAEVIPVDVAANSIIIAAYARGARKYTETPAYNLSQSEVVPITWGEVLEQGRNFIYEYPFEWPLWYPDGNIRTNKFLHYTIIVLFQWLPALFLDFIFLITFQKRFMIRIQKRISLGMNLLQYFTMREWRFKNKKFLQLTNSLSAKDQEIFFTDKVEVDIKDFLKNVVLGARQYCMKENLKTLPMARMYMRFLYVLDRAAKIAFVGGVGWAILNLNKSLHLYQDQYYKTV